MRRLAILSILLLALSLACCSPTTTSSGPTATPTVAPTQTRTPTPTAARPPPVSPLSTPTAAPSATSSPSPRPGPTATPSPAPTLTPRPRPTPAPGRPLAFSLGWQFSANGHLTAGAVVRLDGRPIYLMTTLGRTLYALAETGETLWRAKTEGPIYALAVLDGDRFAIGDDAGRVTVLDARGQRLWRHDPGSRVTALQPWQDGLLAGGWDDRLTYFGQDGQVRWQFDVEGPVSGVATLPGLVGVATLDGWVHGLVSIGAEAWGFGLPTAVTGLEGVEGLGFLMGTQDGRLTALDTLGTPIWQWPPGPSLEGSPVWHAVSFGDDTRPDVLAGSGGAEPVVARLSPRGEVRWQVAVPAPVNALTATDLDDDGQPDLLAGLADGQVLAFDADGGLRGSVHAGLPVWGLDAGAGSVLVRADVVAWQLAAGAGPSSGPWLPAPALVPPPEITGQADGEATLVFLGDASPGRSMEAHLARYGPAYPWAGIAPLLRDADLAVANLEGVLTTQGEPLDKSYLIRAHPRWGQTLVAGGLDLVALANNHALDFGNAGLDETLAVLSALDVGVVGAGRSRAEAHAPAIVTLDGVRVAILNYAAARWDGSADVPTTGRIAWAYPDDVAADVETVRDQADLVVVVLHAGTEYAAEPSADQVAVAHAAIDAGAALVVGHHPHVTQTVEHHKGGLIVYSLGDALFDIPRPAAMRGHLLRVHATVEGLTRAELWPFWIDAEHGYQLRLLDDGEGQPRVRRIYP